MYLQILSFLYLTILYEPAPMLVPVAPIGHLVIMTKNRVKWFQNIRSARIACILDFRTRKSFVTFTCKVPPG
jgi:hypothetical protein